MAKRANHIALYWDACRTKGFSELSHMLEHLRNRCSIWESYTRDGVVFVVEDDESIDVKAEMQARYDIDAARIRAVEHLIAWRLDNPTRDEAPLYADLTEPWKDDDPLRETYKCILYLVQSGQAFSSRNALLTEVARMRGLGDQAVYRMLQRRYKERGQAMPETPEALAGEIERRNSALVYELGAGIHMNTNGHDDGKA